MATWTNTNKSSSSWNNGSKNSASFTAQAKSDVVATMAGRVGYGAIGQAKIGAVEDSYGILTSWSNVLKS